MRDWIRSEEEVLRRIVADRKIMAGAVSFMLTVAFSNSKYAFGRDILVGINICRSQLGLNIGGKPGDIDLLIVPCRGENLYFNRTIAIEVKIVRPTLDRPGRNANSMGGSQARGLLRDGFPYVALLHVSLPDPLPNEYLIEIPELKMVNGEVIEEKGMLIDFFPMMSARRQEGRLAHLGLPKDIGYSCIALSTSADGSEFTANTLNNACQGGRNRLVSIPLVSSVRSLVLSEPNLFTKVVWPS